MILTLSQKEISEAIKTFLLHRMDAEVDIKDITFIFSTDNKVSVAVEIPAIDTGL